MKKKILTYNFIAAKIALQFAQDCAERNVSVDIICSGANATIILNGSVNSQDYQLRIGSTVIETKTSGADRLMLYLTSPHHHQPYNIKAVGCTCLIPIPQLCY
jgi:hypothetical protein